MPYHPWPWFNIRLSTYQYGNCGDKTAVRLISTMGIPMLLIRHLYIDSSPTPTPPWKYQYPEITGNSHADITGNFSWRLHCPQNYCSDVSVMTSQITISSTFCATVCSRYRQRNHQGSASQTLFRVNQPVTGAYTFNTSCTAVYWRKSARVKYFSQKCFHSGTDFWILICFQSF